MTERSQPGTWILQIQATDADGLTSNVSMSQLTILAPKKDDVILSVLWIQPEEGSSIGTLQGLMLHVNSQVPAVLNTTPTVKALHGSSMVMKT